MYYGYNALTNYMEYVIYIYLHTYIYILYKKLARIAIQIS